MQRLALFVALSMMVVGIAGCGLIDPPVPCYDNSDFSCNIGPLGEEDMVCNMAVSLEEACAELIAMLPPMVPIPDICQMIPPEVGTCQVLGGAGDPCAEDPDCGSGTCTDGACG
jgi:hypothetical protein